MSPRTLPDLALRARMSSRVDLPAPEAPIMANSSPGRTVPVIWERTRLPEGSV